jgi:hypothetical protein
MLPLLPWLSRCVCLLLVFSGVIWADKIHFQQHINEKLQAYSTLLFSSRPREDLIGVYKFDPRLLLGAIRNSVAIVELPPAICDQFAEDYVRSNTSRGTYYMHFNEWLVPSMLKNRSSPAHLLYSGARAEDVKWKDGFHELPAGREQRALVYFVSTLPTLWFTTTQRGYNWTQVTEIVEQLPAWQQSRGFDFVAMASHPLFFPRFQLEWNSVEFRHISYMTVDFEGPGRASKDVIIPYLTREHLRFDAKEYLKKFGEDVSLTDMDRFPTIRNPLLRSRLAFVAAGSTQITRKRFRDSRDHPADVLIVSRVPANNHSQLALESKYCFVIRGDTTSTQRLFVVMSFGCVPVIISDDIELPFEKILNWNKFSVRFAEEIVFRNLSAIYTTLRQISDERYSTMFRTLRSVTHLFLYDAENELNPISMTFLDLVVKRLQMCDDFEDPPPQFCVKLLHRLHHAMSLSSHEV